jgi:hypothetical protein
MAKQVASMETDNDTILEVDLRDPRLAAFLAWLLPGLGHMYQGRTGKGVLFFVCIVGTFFYGLYIGGGHVVYASTPNLLTRWQSFCQLGVGLPAMPAAVQALAGDNAPLGDFMRQPEMRGDFRSTDAAGNQVIHPDEMAKWNHDNGDYFDIGTVFTVIAGLLNVLVIYDAYGGPLVIPLPDDKKNRSEKSDDALKDTK